MLSTVKYLPLAPPGVTMSIVTAAPPVLLIVTARGPPADPSSTVPKSTVAGVMLTPSITPDPCSATFTIGTIGSSEPTWSSPALAPIWKGENVTPSFTDAAGASVFGSVGGLTGLKSDPLVP